MGYEGLVHLNTRDKISIYLNCLNDQKIKLATNKPRS